MSDIKPIKNSAEYESALQLLTELLDSNPGSGTADDAKIRILTALIEDYEISVVPEAQADPIEAIRFRLDQLGLRDKDLVPYLGTRSRVSEVLNGKRALTVSMIKNLEEGLGIPASILVGTNSEKRSKRWSAKSLVLMARRGYFGAENQDLDPKTILERGLLGNLLNPANDLLPALHRQTNYRNIESIDQNLMDAWTNKVLNEAKLITRSSKIRNFDRRSLDTEYLNNLFKLSSRTTGVIDVISGLLAKGVVVVIEPHLPGTRLDGATIFTKSNPVIGLTLRHDRMDNFWFTLAHEIAHILLHSSEDISVFYDQIYDSPNALTQVENDADIKAGDLLIPRHDWSKNPLRFASTPTLVRKYAEKVGVHEAVVAGRIRYDSKDWMTHSEIVKSERVRHLFGDKLWEI